MRTVSALVDSKTNSLDVNVGGKAAGGGIAARKGRGLDDSFTLVGEKELKDNISSVNESFEESPDRKSEKSPVEEPTSPGYESTAKDGE